jgi:1,4-alpha-glucan branching enzyme
MGIFKESEGGLEAVARSYTKYGLRLQPNNDITLVEWAPGAKAISIFGEFNDWNRREFWCEKNEFGCFCITLKALPDGSPRIKHG